MSSTPGPGHRRLPDQDGAPPQGDAVPAGGATPPAKPGRVLPLRVEWRRQARRPRTRWSVAVVLALPVVVVLALAVGGEGAVEQGEILSFADLTTQGAGNFTVAILFLTAELLLLLLAALYVGDPVPAEASWGTLRYLLLAPVSRARLAVAKVVVGLGWTVLVTLLLIGWGLLVGGLAYGWAPLALPTGGELGWLEFAPRLLAAVAYVLVTVLPFAAIAFWVGVRTDAPLAAVGAALLTAILSQILQALDALGEWRRALPTYYIGEWTELLRADPLYDQLLRGGLWALLYAAVFFLLGARRLQRADVLS